MQKSVEFKGKKKKLRKICTVQSILSICVLLLLLDHEFDHLEGKMFIDRLAMLRKQMIRSKLADLQRGKFRCDYKVKVKR